MKSVMAFLILAAGLMAMADELKPVKARSWVVGGSDTAALVTQVRGLVSAQGKVVYVAAVNKLIVTDSVDKLELVDKLIRERVPAGPVRNVQIRIQFNGGSSGNQGALVLRPHGVTALSRNTGADQNTVQTLTVSDGGKAYLEITREFPQQYVSFYVNYVNELFGGQMVPFQWRTVGSRLAIEPHIEGTWVRIRMTPELSYVTDQGLNAIAIQRLASEVVVENGRSMQISGLAQGRESSAQSIQGAKEGPAPPPINPAHEKEFSSRFFQRFDDSGQCQSLNVTMTPTIQEIGPPPAGLIQQPASPWK